MAPVYPAFNGPKGLSEKERGRMSTLVSVFVLFLALYGAAVAGLAVFQRALLYHPDESAPPIPSVLSDRGKALSILGHDGVPLHTWWLPPLTPDRPVLVYFHGNAGNQSEREKRAIGFATRGFGLVMPTYRYNAGAGGDPSEDALIADGKAILDWTVGQSIDPSRIILFGESLGTGVSIGVAARSDSIAGLILDSPFDSILALAVDRYWFAPVRWVLKDHFDSLERIKSIDVPLLIGHGGRDRLIPLDHAQRLFDAANEPKTLVIKPEGGHIEVFEHGFAADIDAFVATLPFNQPTKDGSALEDKND